MTRQSRVRQSESPLDDPEQSKRFIDTAKDIGADESPEAFERAFGRVAKPHGLAPKTQSPKE